MTYMARICELYQILLNLVDIHNCYLQLLYLRLQFVRFNDFAAFLCTCFLLFSM